MKMISAFAAALALCPCCPGIASNVAAPAAVQPLARFPNTNGTDIVFSARDHVWSLPQAGGVARRLTSGAGAEFAPRFSPDGRWIAFTGRRGGVQDVYVMPAGGGIARQLTTLASPPPSNGVRRTTQEGLVIAWAPDSRTVIFLSRRLAWNGLYRPFAVALAGGMPLPLPVDRSGYLSFGPDGRSFAFTRSFTEFRNWKRYTGGMAEDIEIYDPATRSEQRITEWKGSDGTPMWVGRRIFFVSDRDAKRRANIWVYNLDTQQTREVTHFADFDVDLPSYGGGQISFQQAGRLWILDLPSERLHAVPVSVPDDRALTGLRDVPVKALIREEDTGYDTDYSLSPDGGQAAFSARGDIFVVPTSGEGAPRNLTATSGADEDHPAFSPDGTQVAYTTDSSGEQELAVRPVAGGAERQLTNFASGFLYVPVWSPHGNWIAIPDGAHRLWLVAADGKGVPRLVATDRNHFMHETDQHDAAFSPDGRWLAYSVARSTRMRAMHLYEVATGTDTTLSTPEESDYRPAFSPDGKYLFFVSDRHEISVQSDRETNAVPVKSQGIYVAALAAGTPPCFGPEVRATASPGALGPASPKPDESRPATHTVPASSNAPAPGAPSPIRVDLAGLLERAVPAPVAAAKIVSLEVRRGAVFYATQPPDTLAGSLPGEASALHRLDPATVRDEVLANGFGSHAVSADGGRVVYKAADDWFTVDARVGQARTPTRLALDGLRTKISPTLEWREMFQNTWRLERDLFVNADMNGNNWKALHDNYARILPQVATRDDLTYLIGELIGEMSSSHTYVGGGDTAETQPERYLLLLGADYAVDQASGRYRITKIYTGDSTREAYRSPLGWPGVDVHVGDYVIAVDGHELTAPNTPDRALCGTGSTVTLTVSPAPDGVRRTMTVTPVANETALRRLDWEQREQAMTAKLSAGRIGYVHLADMQNLGMQEFIHQFYPQLGKEALVIDERWNAGGNIDQMVLERLRRVISSLQTLRDRTPQTQPDQVQLGPKAMLINHFAGSDGDVLPYHFRAYGLGKLVGTRSLGGVRGIEWFWPLLDGGYVTIPQISFYDPAGRWVVENHGVDPDVAVEDKPWEVLTGGDIQLTTAVNLLLKQLPPEPRATVGAPTDADYPDEGAVPPANIGR